MKEKKQRFGREHISMINGGKRGPKQNKPKSHSLPSQNHVNYQFHIISISIIIIHEILQKREEGEKSNWFFSPQLVEKHFWQDLIFFQGFKYKYFWFWQDYFIKIYNPDAFMQTTNLCHNTKLSNENSWKYLANKVYINY